jgi:hypothetical protein
VNTVHRPRGRPRVRSVNLRAFWWVLQREAALRILGWEQDGHLFEAPRELMSWKRSTELRRLVRRELERYPLSRCTDGYRPAIFPAGWVSTL